MKKKNKKPKVYSESTEWTIQACPKILDWKKNKLVKFTCYNHKRIPKTHLLFGDIRHAITHSETLWWTDDTWRKISAPVIQSMKTCPETTEPDMFSAKTDNLACSVLKQICCQVTPDLNYMAQDKSDQTLALSWYLIQATCLAQQRILHQDSDTCSQLICPD